VTDETLAGLYSAYVVLFFAVIACGMTMEAVCPRNPIRHPLRRRWLANAALLVLDYAALRLLLPVTTVGAALLASDRGWGLLNLVELPFLAALLVSLLVLDATFYGLHRLEHVVPLLWRVHRLHHSDPDVDVSTGVRFHPIEALLQAAVAAGIGLVMGVEPLAAGAHMLLLGVIGPFSHANIALPRWLETPLRWLVITPDMHRLHHSIKEDDYQSNYALGLSLWDRLFGTYRAEPSSGYAALRFGLNDRPPAGSMAIAEMLADPLRA
jgi:sterol desaturase/sphingolipid hydroxylase (fatty acid hydroxylase superfamily)